MGRSLQSTMELTPAITDHFILRYLERVKQINIAEVVSEIEKLTQDIKVKGLFAELSDVKFLKKINGRHYHIVWNDNKLVTIMKPNTHSEFLKPIRKRNGNHI